jgi:hypothetical protein
VADAEGAADEVDGVDGETSVLGVVSGDDEGVVAVTDGTIGTVLLAGDAADVLVGQSVVSMTVLVRVAVTITVEAYETEADAVAAAVMLATTVEPDSA